MLLEVKPGTVRVKNIALAKKARDRCAVANSYKIILILSLCGKAVYLLGRLKGGGASHS